MTEITYDKNKNGRVDTWVRMDGARPISATIDSDEDGRIDRWEYYAADGRPERVGESRAKSGRADLWAYLGAEVRVRPEHCGLYHGVAGRGLVAGDRDRRIEFLEVSDVTGKEGIVRREFYRGGAKISGEEDTDGDGVMDRWEGFDAGRLRTVEFDDPKKRDGQPAQRLTYDDRGGLISIETGPDGRGGYRTKRSIK